MAEGGDRRLQLHGPRRISFASRPSIPRQDLVYLVRSVLSVLSAAHG